MANQPFNDNHACLSAKTVIEFEPQSEKPAGRSNDYRHVVTFILKKVLNFVHF